MGQLSALVTTIPSNTRIVVAQEPTQDGWLDAGHVVTHGPTLGAGVGDAAVRLPVAGEPGHELAVEDRPLVRNHAVGGGGRQEQVIRLVEKPARVLLIRGHHEAERAIGGPAGAAAVLADNVRVVDGLDRGRRLDLIDGGEGIIPVVVVVVRDTRVVGS